MSMQRLPYAADCVRRHIVRPAQISHGLTLGLSLPDTTAVCAENLNSDVMVMKAAEDRV